MHILRRDVLMASILKKILPGINICEDLHTQSGLFLNFKKDSEKSDTGSF